jgi:glycosyltransferase involved in cell wall biosynthesis
LLARHARPWGGIERHVRDLAWGLARRGHQPLLFHERAGRDPAYVEPFAQVWEADRGREAALKQILAARPDVVYVHKWEDAGLVEALLDRGLPLVVMVHDHDLTCPRRHRYTLVGRRPCVRPMGWGCLGCLPTLERVPGSRRPGWRPWRPRLRWLRLLRRLPRVVVASPAMEDQLALNGVERARITVAPPIPAFAPPPRPAPFPRTEHHLLFVGQVVRTKGWDLLFEAYQQLDDPPPLTVAGSGNDLEVLRARVRASGLEGRVNTPGWLSPPQLAQAYARAFAVVVPSRWQEPFGLVGLEAMAWARPVVAFEVGGIPSWLVHERTGLLVPPEDPAALAAALGRLLADPAWAAELGRCGHQHRLQRFDFERSLDRLVSLLDLPTPQEVAA